MIQRRASISLGDIVLMVDDVFSARLLEGHSFEAFQDWFSTDMIGQLIVPKNDVQDISENVTNVADAADDASDISSGVASNVSSDENEDNDVHSKQNLGQILHIFYGFLTLDMSKDKATRFEEQSILDSVEKILIRLQGIEELHRKVIRALSFETAIQNKTEQSVIWRSMDEFCNESIKTVRFFLVSISIMNIQLTIQSVERSCEPC